MRLTTPAPVRAALATAVTAAVVMSPALLPISAQAADQPEISEIAYAGGEDTDFVEIAADPGTDVSGWTVGTVTRGGAPQSGAHVTTLPSGTVVGDSGALAVDVPITNSVDTGSRADGSYGSSAFVVDADGALIDFDQIGGEVGGRGVTATNAATLPESVRGQEATPTGATAPAGRSIQLVDGSWIADTPTPGALPGDDSTDPPVEPGEVIPIADIQGTGAESPLVGQTVTTQGVVTAVWAEGGLNGYTIQTAGTGGSAKAAGEASDGLFVYSAQTKSEVAVGDSVQVTGSVSEYYGQTQVTVSASGLTQLDEALEAPTPIEGEFPTGDAEREALESMLVLPTGDITVTDNYGTNRYGEVGLVNGTEPLFQATDVVAPGEAAQEYEAENLEREFVLDDGGSVDYTGSASDVPLPYVSTDEPVRVGAATTFTDPVVVGYGFDKWRLQPTTWLTGENAGQAQPAQFEDTREAAPQDVGGDITVSSFNVLNYFTTTGDQLSGCTFYEDRNGDPTTVRGGCDARGAFDAQNLERQQAKIVDAINALDASVLSLEEIERSSAFGKDRDESLSILVDALNEDAGEETWAFAESPAELPEDEDVIRTAFIYQPAEVTPVGDSTILTGSDAFGNAREPLAQAFTTGEDDDPFVAIVNHFKSKGSGSGDGNVDNGDGQGNSNADRVAQAEALVAFADEQKEAAGTDDVVLLGDFNSYTEEDPMQVLYEAGFTNIGKEFTDEQTYLFGGRVGSLDHVLASESLVEDVTDADIWNINSVESIGLEYSRYNANVTNLYAEGPFRSSDHDPLVMGLNRSADDSTEEPTEDPTDDPSDDPTGDPTGDPSEDPTDDPSTDPSQDPSDDPTDDSRDDDQDGGQDDDGRDGGQDDDQGDDSRDGDRGDGDRTDDGTLPRTGTGLTALAVGGGLLVVGAVALIAARRRLL
jgi:predicted extracellular nuclease